MVFTLILLYYFPSYIPLCKILKTFTMKCGYIMTLSFASTTKIWFRCQLNFQEFKKSIKSSCLKALFSLFQITQPNLPSILTHMHPFLFRLKNIVQLYEIIYLLCWYKHQLISLFFICHHLHILLILCIGFFHLAFLETFKSSRSINNPRF
jgi:hypothetical protein